MQQHCTVFGVFPFENVAHACNENKMRRDVELKLTE